MKNSLLIFLFILFLGAFSCEQETESGPQIPLMETIAGDWLVVYKMHKDNNFMFEDPARGVVTEWNCYYVLSLKINPDHTYYINDSEKTFTSNGKQQAVGGKWLLDDHNTITFHCSDSVTTSFRAYLNKTGQLVLENSEVLIRHNRKP